MNIREAKTQQKS